MHGPEGPKRKSDHYQEAKTELKKIAIVVAAAALTSTQTLAAAFDLANSGYWRTYVTRNGDKTVCGMNTRYNPNGAMLMVKYVQGQGGLLIHIFKQSWRFPASTVEVPLVIGVDKNQI
jgi:hypothetical protein